MQTECVNPTVTINTVQHPTSQADSYLYNALSKPHKWMKYSSISHIELNADRQKHLLLNLASILTVVCYCLSKKLCHLKMR